MPEDRPAAASAVRSLAADLRARSDAALRDLLMRRPDLARPRPADLGALAGRACSRPSVQRAVEDLDAGRLHVLEALVLADKPTRERAAALLGCQVGDLSVAADDLWARALTWRSGNEEHVVRAAIDLLGGHLAGLGAFAHDLIRPTPDLYEDPARLDEAIGRVSQDARAVLERLARGPAIGVVALEGSLRTASQELVGAGLLAWLSADQVALPREVSMRMRTGLLYADAELAEPSVNGAGRAAGMVDAAAGAQATDLLERVDEVAARWGATPPRVLRTGGLAVRDLRVLAAALDLDLPLAAFVVELAAASGLLADDAAAEPFFAPTPAYDAWHGLPAERRWAALASAWVGTMRAPALVGTPSPGSGGGVVNALGPDAVSASGRQRRGDVLRELAMLPGGIAPDAVTLDARLRWRHPLRIQARTPTGAEVVLREAEWLGVTGRGALSSAGRVLATGSAAADPYSPQGQQQLADAIRPHLPEPVEEVLLQADLTAVAPGRLAPDLADFIRLVADVESRGAGAVYRFSAASVRRAFDAGWGATDIEAMLARHSRTPVPQPLAYLISDVARRHGRTRIGAVASYVRTDDETALRSMLADRALAPLALRALAPTVAVSPVSTATVLDLLRQAGYPPVPESAEGIVATLPATQYRTPVRRAPPVMVSSHLDTGDVAAIVELVRQGDAEAERRRREEEDRDGPALPASDPSTTLTLMREAAADRRPVWVGHADASGQVRRMVFYPRSVVGGRVLGRVEGSNLEQALSVHRIVGVAEA